MHAASHAHLDKHMTFNLALSFYVETAGSESLASGSLNGVHCSFAVQGRVSMMAIWAC